MKDLEKLVAECKADLDSIGIRYGCVVRWEINTRAKRRWGQCEKLLGGFYAISISARLLQDDVNDMAVKNTILHELLHTVKGCHGHTGLWANLAAKVNRCLPQYTIQRRTDAEEKSVERADPRYVLKCTGCGKEYGRYRMTDFVRCPRSYRCGDCGGDFERIR